MIFFVYYADISICMMYGIYNRLVQSFLHSCNNCILCDAEVLKELIAWCRSTEGLHSDELAVDTDVFAPSKLGECFDTNSGCDVLWKYCILVLIWLILKQIHTWHADNADINILGCKLFLCLDSKGNFRTGCDDDGIWCILRRIL